VPVATSPIQLTTANGTDYEEFVGEESTYRERFAVGEPEVVRVLQCDWDQRYLLIEDLLGYSTWAPSGAIERRIPEPHPDRKLLYPAAAELIATLGRPRQDDPSGLVNFEKARYAVTYRAPDFRILKDNQLSASATAPELARYVSRLMTLEGENLPVGNGTYKWAEPAGLKGTPLNEAPAKFFGTLGLTYTWHEVPATPDYGSPDATPYPPNINRILDAQGCVNSNTFDNNSAMTAETVLFIGAEWRRYVSANGQQLCFEITYKFSFRRTGWQKPYDPASGNFYLVTLDGETAGQRIYPTYDLNTLFTLPSY
jgi:hypothetical protein